MSAAFQFARAKRENVSLLIGLAGPSGSGKTYSAMLLARGLAGAAPFAVIDTEAGRAKHYADLFTFDHGDLRPPFRPDAYADAIRAADEARYPVIVVDSFSHEHAGEGGVLDWQEEQLAEMVARAQKRQEERRAEWQIRESLRFASWIEPKTAHKRMVSRLLQVRAHLILCLRAEDKMEISRDDKGRTVVQPMQTLAGFKGWIPICDKRLPFELTMSLLMLPDAPGVPIPIKLQEQHRAYFPEGRPVTEESGRRLAEWARGGAGQLSRGPVGVQPCASPEPSSGSGGATTDDTATSSLLTQIQRELLRRVPGQTPKDKAAKSGLIARALGVGQWRAVVAMDEAMLADGLRRLKEIPEEVPA